MRTSDAVVIGAGVIGSATARAFARAGKRVRLLERYTVGHKHGSSHGRARIFRFSYPDPRYVRMAMDALPLWRELERERGVQLLTTTGGLDCGAHIQDNANAMEECGAPIEVLDGREANRRFPELNLPANEPVLFQPDSGVVVAEDAVRAFVDSAAAYGAKLLERTRVVALEPSDQEVLVHTEDQRFTAGAVVVTAGSWANDVLGTAGIELPVRPTSETVAYFPLESRPPTLVEWGEPSRYALWNSGDGLKAGEHIAGPETHPDSTRAPDPDSLERISAWVAERFPTAVPHPVRAETCMYTVAPDEELILERHGRIVVGSACSGHGFKFAPLIGERLAALADEVASA